MILRFTAILLGAFLLAIFCLQWWQEPAYPLWAWALLCLVMLIGVADWGPLSFFFPVGLGLSLGFAVVSWHASIASPLSLERHADGREIALLGTIVDIPDRRATRTQYTVRAEAILDVDGARRAEGKTLILDRNAWPRFAYGQRMLARGTLEAPKPVGTFAYDEYLASMGIRSILRSTRIDAAPGRNGSGSRLGMLYAAREALEGRISELLPEPHASFLAGLLLGSRRGMPEGVTDSFRATGLSHIVAISGYNITMIILILTVAFSFLPRPLRLAFTLASIGAFVIMAGASASAVRAAIMGSLGLVALSVDRMQTSRLTILWAAAIMVAWNPLLLWHDAGFQLSFLAVIGLLELSPLLRPALRWFPDAMGLRDMLLTTIAAQLSALPWSVHLFGQLPVISPVSNILVLPAVPYAMLLGSLGLVLSVVWMPLGQVMGYAAWSCMEYILRVAAFLAGLPGSTVTVTHHGALAVCLYYAALAAAVGAFHWYRNRDVVLPHHGRRVSLTGVSPGTLNVRATSSVPGRSSLSNLGISFWSNSGIK